MRERLQQTFVSVTLPAGAPSPVPCAPQTKRGRFTFKFGLQDPLVWEKLNVGFICFILIHQRSLITVDASPCPDEPPSHAARAPLPGAPLC